MPEDSLAERVRNWLTGADLSDIAERLQGPDRPVDAFDFNRNQTPTFPQLDVFVQITARGKWQDVNSHYHSTNLVPLLFFRLSHTKPISPNYDVSILIILVR
jgi:hypothetical protein